MKNKHLILAVLLSLIPSLATAQEEAKRGQVVSLAEGGFVGFKSQVAPAGAINAAAAVEKQGEFRTRAFIDENHMIHRLLVDDEGKYVFAYNLAIEAVPASKKFNITVAPLDSRTEQELLASSAGGPPHIATLPQSGERQVLDDGDSIALDLLVNQKTGIKIVDLVKVSFDRANLWQDSPATLPRDFTLDAVALRVVDFRLLIDGNLVGAGKPGTDFTGALIWCYVEGQGRFIFSLVPREGYQFQKVGIITDNRIEFSVKGKRFEWLSSAPVLSGGGSWNLWVLHDPAYLPFGTLETAKQEKSRLDKLDDTIKSAMQKAARIGDPTPAAYRKALDDRKKAGDAQPSSKRFRTMVGAADRMENLLPK